MIGMLKRHEVQVLLNAGHTQEDVARRVGASLRSVRRIANESVVAHVEDDRARDERQIGRPSKVESFRKLVGEILQEEPRIASLEILRRARLAGYAGGKSALYGLISSVRPRKVLLETRFEGVPGEFTQHDFGHVEVAFLDGTRRRVHFFASRLKYSRWVEVTLVADERVETLVRTLVDHFTAMGGIPLLAVFDRPKTVALKWRHNGEVTEWNPTFAYVTLELGLGVELCWPHSPEQKGSVENLVKWVKGSFKFQDQADLVQQLADWQSDVNERVPSRATGVPPVQRMAQERVRLRTVRVTPENLALRIPTYVGPTAVVMHDGHPYTTAPEAVGMPAPIFLYRDRVKIVAGRFEIEHPRQFVKGEGSSLPEHRAARLAAVSGVRAKRYRRRQDLFEVGAAAIEYLTELIYRRPKTWYQDVDDLHDLLQAVGPEVMRTAFAKGLSHGTFGAEYVLHFVRSVSPTAEASPSTEVIA